MKIRKINKILTEDFPEKYRELVSKLAFTLNPFLDNLVESLDGNLSFTDNIDSEIKELVVRPDVDLPLKVKTELNFCNSIIVTRITNLDNTSAVLASAPFVEFTNRDEGGFKLIEIKNITGLVTSNKYRIRLILLNE